MSSAAVTNPCFSSFYRWPDVTMEGVESYSAMAQGGRGSNTFEIWVFSPIFLFPLSLSLSLLSIPLSFLGVGKEVRR
jgi:hypothetical protein